MRVAADRQGTGDRLRRLKPILVADARRNAWLWALKQTPGTTLDDLLCDGADELARRIIAEQIQHGKKVPPHVVQALHKAEG